MFSVTTKVRQGCILSPVLFGIVLDFATRRTEETETGIDRTDTKVLGDLDFADDICLLNSCTDEMQAKTNCSSSSANKGGVVINASKTEFMRANYDRKPLLRNDMSLANVDRFIYLGSVQRQILFH